MPDQASPTFSYVWHAPGRPLTIALHLEVVDRLALAVQEGCQALPRRGLEIGGMLLGRIRRRHGQTTVEIENFDLLESEHAVGPSYLLSAADRRVLGRRLRQLRSSQKLSVVGFFRSHTRKDLAITMEDTGLLSDYFADPSMVFLLIHAIPDRPLQGGYYVWEGRDMRAGRPREEFPFRSALLMSGDYELFQRAPSASAARTKGPGIVTGLISLPGRLSAALAPWFSPSARPRAAVKSETRRLPPNSWSGLSRRIRQQASRFSGPTAWRHALQWISAAIIMVGAVAGGLLYHGPTRATATIRRPARTNAGTAPAVRLALPSAPPAAVEETPLPTAQLEDVAAEKPSPAMPAETAAADKPLPAMPSEAAAADKPLPVVRPPEAVAAEKPLPTAPPSALSPVTAPSPLIAKPVSQPSPLRTPKALAASATPVRTMDVRKLSPPSRPLKPPSLPDAPKVANTLLANVDPLNESAVVRFEAPQIPDPLVTMSVETLPVSHQALLLARRHPTGAKDKQALYTPPALTRKATLDIPSELRHRLQHVIPINVKLYLDTSGKVEYAELLSDGTGGNRDLASMAVFSSRHCEFLPARLGGEAVPAEVVLRYRFAPDRH